MTALTADSIREIAKAVVAELTALAPGTSLMEDSLTVKEAAREIKRSPQFIYGLIYEGEIPDRKQKGRRIVLKSDLNDWVKRSMIVQ